MGESMATMYPQTQPPPEYMALYGLTKFKQAALMQTTGTVLMTVAILALFSSLPFYGIYTPPSISSRDVDIYIGGLSIGPAWYIITMIFIMIAGFTSLFPSLSWFIAWKPTEFHESSRLVKTWYIVGSLLILIALLIIVVLNAVNTPDIIKELDTRRSIALGQLWPILIANVGAILFYIAWIGIARYVLKLSEVFNEPALRKTAIFIPIYGSIYLITTGSLLITYYAEVCGACGAALLEILKVTLGLSILIAIIGLAAWILIYSQAEALTRKIQVPKPQA
jgi:hypothetical protein